ncbi:HNH endonuclease [Zhenhengia yiwuensis]|uniref:HNH endonuclease n=1 Tax=Zhenhengia yiwuensis TaxID=2763666 RepID=UPI00290A5C54|nr:HNH endonuclease [Zhenhengia yiwuensis]MDU6359779.1 HNH endonuclease [Clostridiales bacterium]MDY3369678.1 HNH endonuclease [Zhenhengia yiwuensis]
MIIFKNNASTLQEILINSKHASPTEPQNLKEGDIILIAQTKDKLPKGEKSIRYIMKFKRLYKDDNDESVKLWGKKWPYIIEGEDVTAIEPFNIEDIQKSNKNYDPIVSFGEVEASDEQEILNWINNYETVSLEKEDIEITSLEFDKDVKSPQDLLDLIDKKYGGTPKFRHYVIKQIQRPSSIRNAVIKLKGTTCQICGEEGFEKKNGSKYCEVHHMLELSKGATGTLQSWNLVVLCPTCHKKLHYAKDVEISILEDSKTGNECWQILLEGNEYRVNGK